MLYVANSGNNSLVSVINSTDNSIVKTWITYTKVVDILHSPLNNYTYIVTSHKKDDVISVLNFNNSFIENIKVTNPTALTFNPLK